MNPWTCRGRLKTNVTTLNLASWERGLQHDRVATRRGGPASTNLCMYASRPTDCFMASSQQVFASWTI
jgi:hypothetical protein